MPIPKKNKITCLNDWRPVALTPIFSKCFEKLIRDHICSVLPASLDPLQFAYRRNRSTDDAIAFTLHTALSHLENKNTYVRMLFVDYSSAFNTIVPATLVEKLQTLGLNRSLCSWILDFLTGRSQVVRMGNNTSSPLTLNTGAPQGCVLSPHLYSLYTHDCTATHSSNVMVKFADDTTVIGLITDNDETAYREEGTAFSLRLSGKWTVRTNSPYITLPLTQHATHCTLPPFTGLHAHTAIIQPICYHWTPYNAHPQHCICIICCTFAQLSIAQLICCKSIICCTLTYYNV